jgi:collagenase-like PrtC family protease
MQLILPCNWDIREIALAKRYSVTELYGQLNADPFGGGRASFMAPEVTRRRARDFIRRVRAGGMDFNYLLSGVCMGNREFTRSGQLTIRRFIDWLCGIDVNVVTVSTPFLLKLVRKAYPHLKVCISSMINISSVAEAKFWEEEGADVLIILWGRNFPLLKSIRQSVACALEVIPNLICLNNCPLSRYHGVVVSHGSQSAKGSFHFPYCEFQCTFRKLTRPWELIASPWIRPEDLGVYEEAGVTRLKIVDRCSPTSLLERIVKAYSERRYEGNLADLLPGLQPVDRERLPAAKLFRHFFRPLDYNVAKALRFRGAPLRPAVFIDNGKLKGFIDFFLERDCRNYSCEECGYCARIAGEALRISPDEARQAASRLSACLDLLVSGGIFRFP